MDSSFSNRNALPSIPESYNANGWDDSSRSLYPPEEDPPVQDVVDVPLDGGSVREEFNGGGSSSLPHIEELKMATSPGSRRSGWGSSLLRGRRKIYLLGFFFVLVLILSISLPKSKNDESSKSDSSGSPDTGTNSSNTTSSERKCRPRFYPSHWAMEIR
jgi:hypothetical protein